ncbi:MAG: hypothetical protein LLG44_13070, partial [Chloroflexi bacterium]|nr:hypothetical protein [Chloroflexota bacterium]
DQGRLQALGTPSELARQLWQGIWIEVELRAAPDEALVQALNQMAFVKEWSYTSGKVLICMSDEHLVPDLVSAICASGGRIYSVQPQQHSLSDIYFRIQQDVKQTGGAR